MIYTLAVAIIALACLTVSQWAWASLYRAQIREHARERNLLLNQLLHLAGRTWQPPPAAEPLSEDDELVAITADLLRLDPSQLP